MCLHGLEPFTPHVLISCQCPCSLMTAWHTSYMPRSHAKIQRFLCMRSCPWDSFIDQTRAVCAEPLTSGVAISDSSLATAAANAVAGFTCFRKLQADLQRARIDVNWSSPMPTGLSRLPPRISNLLAQSMLSPVEITYQHSMSTLSVEKYRKRLIIPTQCAINMADLQGAKRNLICSFSE